MRQAKIGGVIALVFGIIALIAEAFSLIAGTIGARDLINLILGGGFLVLGVYLLLLKPKT